MITLPNGKICFNEQEAIQWLLDNYPIPFQCSADYVADTEIGLGTVINPTPAKVKIGSIIFFADSKVSTVVGLTANGFICSDQYNDLVDDIVYVSNVQLNASGHLIVTLSNATTIDAGLVKQVSSFSINASQHLIVSYNDGTTTDLGAIFTGNVNIAGNLTADSIIENMTGYTFTPQTSTNITLAIDYAGVVKNGNKITFVIAGKATKTGSADTISLGYFSIPNSIMNKLYPMVGNVLDLRTIPLVNDWNSYINTNARVEKYYQLFFYLRADNMVLDTQYAFRYEVTFLLSNNLAA